MNTRPFGNRCGFQVPRVNIGGMRLPGDMDEAVALIRQAIDAGLRYIDTSRGYGDSEIKIGEALKDGYREKVILSTKCSPWITKIEESDDASADCTRKRIEESMQRLQVDYLDFYQVWNIGSREQYDWAVQKGGMVDGIRKAMDEGLVGHTGFTTHDSVQNILDYIEEADWAEIILFTYNILNHTYAPAIEAAHRKGIGTVIMNPIVGGILTKPSELLTGLVEKAGAVSQPDLGLRYVLSNPNVDCIISGINAPSDIVDSLASADREMLPNEMLATINSELGKIVAERNSFCTGCRYCLPCPQEINIPALLNMVAEHRFLRFVQHARDQYTNMQTPRADACIECGACESKCTQHIQVMKEMAYAVEHLGA